MTTAGEIMAEALRRADIEYSRTRSRAQVADTWQPAGIRLSPQQLRARRARSTTIALALGAFVLMIFAVTVVRLGSGALSGDGYMRPVQTTK